MLKLKQRLKKKFSMDAKAMRCRVCGNNRGMVHKYGLEMCRKCFKEHAKSIGFTKYS
ncbi:MAG: 30S ribosomal protein S14 [Candidatus Altiarchaeota archaeon]